MELEAINHNSVNGEIQLAEFRGRRGHLCGKIGKELI